MRNTFLALAIVASLGACADITSPPTNTDPVTPTVLAAANTDPGTCVLPNGTVVSRGQDVYGYNRCAREFNGTYSSWCVERGAAPDCVGEFSLDDLRMKWSFEWDLCNFIHTVENCTNAKLSNHVNGMRPDGSRVNGQIRIEYYGSYCGPDYTPLPDGGYCIWGDYEVVFEKWMDLEFVKRVVWYARVTGRFGN